ncbi:MAG TPA: glycosyltransferase [Thermoanaerobaculia bacterium]|jgi:glycosyltransferase involved in cell wall biosynthesis
MRILFVTARPPWPSRRGDQARTAGWVRELGRRHELSVVALTPPGFQASSFPPGVAGRAVPVSRLATIAALPRAVRLPGQVALHVSTRLRRAFDDERERFRPDVVVPVLSRVGWLAEPDCGVPGAGVPTVIDLVDSLALNFENRARRQRLLAPLLRWEARRVAAWDRRLAACLSAATVVSQRDRRSLVDGAPELASKVHVVPFGVSVPADPPAPPGGDVVLLSGNLGYFPTVDGAVWFAAEVWPRIRELRPAAVWRLAGARPARPIRRLSALPGVELHAEPADLGALRRAAAVAVVPLGSGSGTPIKTLEAMADGVPVVTTSWGRQGLDAIDGDAVAVADAPEAFAGEVVRLLDDRRAAAAQSRRAWEWLRQRHDLERVAASFEALLRGAVEGRA